MKEIEDRFALIIKRFCATLALFVQVIIQPTQNSTDIIKKMKKRSYSFDQYVSAVEEFNDIISHVIKYLKNIIVSLNKLFLDRSLSTLTDFLDKIREFLMFLINDNVLIRLNDLEERLNKRFNNKIDILHKIGRIKCIIFRLFDISIDISAIFIPQLTIVKKVLIVIEQKSDSYLQYKTNLQEDYKINIDDITKQLLDIQLRSETLLSLDPYIFLRELDKRETEQILISIEQLQKDYIEMSQMSMHLKKEIERYKISEKNIFMLIKDIFIKPANSAQAE